MNSWLYGKEEDNFQFTNRKETPKSLLEDSAIVQ